MRFVNLILVAFVTCILGQTNNYEIIKSSINNSLVNFSDGTFEVTTIMDCDSINSRLYNNSNGLLDDSFLFEAFSINNNSKSIWGIFKNNQISWVSKPVITDPIYRPKIEAVLDLNNNGRTEIIMNYTSGNHQFSIDKWSILSWNGNSMNIINDTTNLGSSVINMVSSSGRIVDLNGDGIFELLGNDIDPESNSKVVYSWDGQLYGNWSDFPHGVDLIFTAANRLEADVNSLVKVTTDNKLTYYYKISNNSTSEQNILYIFIEVSSDVVLAYPPENWFSRYYKDQDIISFQASHLDLDKIDNTELDKVKKILTEDISETTLDVIRNNRVTPIGIKPGFTISGFSLNSQSLPTITSCYLQGFKEQLKFFENLEIDKQEEISNVYNNSYIVSIVGPGKINEDMGKSEFLNNIINYTNRSYDFGWIKNQQTFHKYATYLNAAQTALEQNQINQAKSDLESILQEVDIDSTANLTSEAYALLKFNTEYLLENLPEETPGLTVKLVNSNNELLTTGTLKYYEGGWKDAVDNGDGTFTVDTKQSSVSLRMNYEYASQTISNVSVTSDTFAFQTVNTQVLLQDSQSNPITDEATVKYYSGGWRDFGTTVNGVAEKELLPNNYSFRMNYAFASNDKKQDTKVNPIVVFQTVNTQVQLQDRQGNPITDEATVKYYSSGWRDFGTTVNGVAQKELLPNNYSFRMNYAFANNDKKQDTEVDPVVVFQTVNTQVQLIDSQGNPITEEATVKYYSGGWRDFGTIINGVAEKELLPKNYSFRMNYAFASNDKKQDTKVNPVVVFQTVNTQVELRDSQSNPITDEATVKYYSGGWRDFGTTINGVAEKELLPNDYSFRMNYAFASNDKKQDTEVDPVVVFQTVNTQVQLEDSQGNPINEEATVKYYSGGWRDFGTTINGVAVKELLPKNYSFRMNYAFASNDKKQDTEVNPVVVFQTVNTQVQLQDSEGNPISEEATVKYYSGGWRDFGTTINGVAEKELLPKNYSFRMNYAFISNDKKQDVGADNIVTFSTMLCTVSVEDQQAQPIDNAVVRYYAGGWRDFGNTVNGIVTKELLPKNISFRATYNSVQEQKQQDISSNSNVEFILNMNE